MNGLRYACQPSRIIQAKNRGVEDILLAVVDGLKGGPEAITAVFPETIVQTCIVHLLRNSMDFVSYKDHKAVATALKDIYRTGPLMPKPPRQLSPPSTPVHGGQKYPDIGQSWRRVWQEVIPFFSFPGEVRRIIYATNAIEALNSKLRRAIPARGHFPAMRPRPSCSI
ncbi:transposase [Acidiphilium sp.]|uniref:transposase n=2 Tax=Acidiphilium TaxID=522 RepID=UPI0009DA2E65